MTLAFRIRAELTADIPAIDEVHRAAFGQEERIPELVARLRDIEAVLPTQSFVAVTPGEAVIGHVMLSHNWLDSPKRLIDILVLSPLGVSPVAQRQGIGTALVHHAVAAASQTSAPVLMLEGSPKFYGKRGFIAANTLGIARPSQRIPEAALQMVKLPSYEPAVTGTLVYRQLWWELDCVGLR